MLYETSYIPERKQIKNTQQTDCIYQSTAKTNKRVTYPHWISRIIVHRHGVCFEHMSCTVRVPEMGCLSQGPLYLSCAPEIRDNIQHARPALNVRKQGQHSLTTVMAIENDQQWRLTVKANHQGQLARPTINANAQGQRARPTNKTRRQTQHSRPTTKTNH